MIRQLSLWRRASRAAVTPRLAIAFSQAAHSRKPDFSKEDDKKHFDHTRLESDIYKWWEDNGFFAPQTRSGDVVSDKPFVVPMPPPNVTGYLHMGHALFVSIQDTIVRFHRMRGRETLWLPGTDHAGIATQLLVEKELASKGSSRQKMGREAFIEKVWEWKKDKGGGITTQLRRLGASADWSREKFTLDDDMSTAVKEAFVRLYDKGLIYRGDYMVNWSPSLQTAVSDLEVEYSEEKGYMYHFKYYLVPEGSDGESSDTASASDREYIPIATTRLETVFGDTALCVHPEDDRYRHLIGRRAYVPLCDRDISIIADPYVDPDFGTGALKITPAHDVNDYTLGKSHSLDSINILNKDGTMNSVCGPKYDGMDRFECRERLWEDMEREGVALRREAVDNMRVPRSQRGGEVIEPMISTQWFVKTEGMRHKAMNAVTTGEISILPNRFEKVWQSWLEVDRDWCVSRQLWWGHQIPVFYKVGGGEQDFVVAKSLTEAQEIANIKWGSDVDLVQDEDVLDTWFSSGLWPFATVGWPGAENSTDSVQEEYNRYFPAALLETGYDILFFWVARMAMMSLELTGKSPFETVYMHGLVRDHEGNKMSKTRGNVIDPVISIGVHGCDALRMTLLSGTTPGMDISVSENKMEANRNFVNKLWNVGKYVQHSRNEVTSQTDYSVYGSKYFMQDLPLLERYIVSRAHQVCISVTDLLTEYKFAEASREISDFTWNELADWFIEGSKSRLKPDLLSSEDNSSVDLPPSTFGDVPNGEMSTKVLLYVWELSLTVLHPFMPFITETLWQLLDGSQKSESLMISSWPLSKPGDSLYVDSTAVTDFEVLKSMVRAIRNTRAEYNVSPSKRIGAIIEIKSDNMRQSIAGEIHSLSFLGRLNKDNIEFSRGDSDLTKRNASARDDYIQLVIHEGVVVYLPLSELMDKEKEIARINKQLSKLEVEAGSLRNRLNGKNFVERAKPEVVAQTRSLLKEKEDMLAALILSLDRLQSS